MWCECAVRSHAHGDPGHAASTQPRVLGPAELQVGDEIGEGACALVLRACLDGQPTALKVYCHCKQPLVQALGEARVYEVGLRMPVSAFALQTPAPGAHPRSAPRSAFQPHIPSRELTYH